MAEIELLNFTPFQVGPPDVAAFRAEQAAARTEVERIAKEVLTNPVIEEFSYRLDES